MCGGHGSWSRLDASAAIVYGNYSGASVNFLQVTEDANSPGDFPPLFGAPTVSGNSMSFSPVGFNANAAGAAGSDVTDGQLSFGIQAKTNYVIPSIQLSEAGDTTIVGFGTDATLTKVVGYVFVTILEVDGTPINAVGDGAYMTFTPHAGEYRLGTHGGGGPFYTTAWSGGLTLNINQILVDNGVSFIDGATLVQINLDNTLLATSENGTQSFIAKKAVGGVAFVIETEPIPEPSSALLALVGCGLVGGFRLRRR